MPKLAHLLLPLLLALASCDTIGDSGIDGRWRDLTPTLLGECCGVDVTIHEVESRIEGAGEVRTPHVFVGQYRVHPVTVTGTRTNNRLRLTLASALRSGTLLVHLDAEDPLVYHASLTGSFGSADSLRLFHSPE